MLIFKVEALQAKQVKKKKSRKSPEPIEVDSNSSESDSDDSEEYEGLLLDQNKFFDTSMANILQEFHLLLCEIANELLSCYSSGGKIWLEFSSKFGRILKKLVSCKRALKLVQTAGLCKKDKGEYKEAKRIVKAAIWVCKKFQLKFGPTSTLKAAVKQLLSFLANPKVSALVSEEVTEEMSISISIGQICKQIEVSLF